MSKSKSKASESTSGTDTELVPGKGPIEPGEVTDRAGYEAALAAGTIAEIPRTELLSQVQFDQLRGEIGARIAAALADLRTGLKEELRAELVGLVAETLPEALADAPAVVEVARVADEARKATGREERRPMRGRTDGRRRHHSGAFTFGREWVEYEVTRAEFDELRRDPCIHVELID